MLISLDCIGQESITMLCEQNLNVGDVCKISSNHTVKKCLVGEDFFGVVQKKIGNSAAVIYRGFVTVPYSGTAPAIGYTGLAGDGSGKVKSSETARKYHIATVDTTKQQVCILL